MSPLDRFDSVRVVNLVERADRRRETEAALRRLGAPVDGARIAFFPAVRPPDAGPFPSLGARGCFMSHLKILQAAQAAGVERLLILEDDIDFAADAAERLGRFAPRLAAGDWGVFYGGHACKGPVPAPGADGLAEVPATTAVGCTHMIALRGPAIADAVAFLEAMLARPPGSPEGGPMHVDGAYSWFRAGRPEMVTLAAVPQVGLQRPSRSDVADLPWYDRAPVLRDLAAAARRALRG